jgi:hypothetical protein
LYLDRREDNIRKKIMEGLAKRLRLFWMSITVRERVVKKYSSIYDINFICPEVSISNGNRVESFSTHWIMSRLGPPSAKKAPKHRVKLISRAKRLNKEESFSRVSFASRYDIVKPKKGKLNTVIRQSTGINVDTKAGDGGEILLMRSIWVSYGFQSIGKVNSI